MTNQKRNLILEGLDCANCAAKIENKVNEMSEVKSATINFVARTLTFEAENPEGIDRLTSQITAAVLALEPDVKVVVEAKEPNESKHPKHPKHREKHLGLIVGAILFGVAIALKFPLPMEFAIFLTSYCFVGGNVLLKAVRNLFRGQVFDENFLMSVATVGAFAIQQFPEGVAVMLFYQIGEWIQDLAVNRSRKSIADLMDIRPDYANRKTENGSMRVPPEEVRVGDFIIVKPGEKVPLDGQVTEGYSMVDTSALTGESVPRDVEVGSEVLSGFINKNGLLTIEVKKEFEESTVSKILDLVQNAGSRKAPTEHFITKFARYYTPIVVLIALGLAVIPPIVLQGATFSEWVYRALIFLVISCPCALVISIPLGFFGGIGGASKNGILIKGSNYLEALNRVEIVVFDKTGTLTKGVFKVAEINPEVGLTKEELLEFASYAESYSNHPIATSILSEYGRDVHQDEIEHYNEIAGHGIKAIVKQREVLAGNIKLMNLEKIPYVNVDVEGTVVYVAIDKKFAGTIRIADELKEDSKGAIRGLKQLGVKKTVMLTGDSRAIAKKVSDQLELDEFYAELLPDQKVEQMERMEKEKSRHGKLLFIGDGINDAPVLARADVGIAMGGLGSDAAIEAADIVIMNDEPSKISTAIRIAKRTRRVVWQNIVFAMAVKLFVLALGAGGVATMWEAVFADVGVTILAVLNAMRVLQVQS